MCTHADQTHIQNTLATRACGCDSLPYGRHTAGLHAWQAGAHRYQMERSPLRKSATVASTPQRRRIFSGFLPCVVTGRRHNLGHLLLRSLDLTLLEELLHGAQRGLGDHVLAALLIELH